MEGVLRFSNVTCELLTNSNCLDFPQKWTFCTISFRLTSHFQNSGVVQQRHGGSLKNQSGWRIVLRLTCWVCGRCPSTLEREKARCHQTSEIKETDTELVHGFLAHKKPPPPLGSPQGPRQRPTVGSWGKAVSYERGTPVSFVHIVPPFVPRIIDTTHNGLLAHGLVDM